MSSTTDIIIRTVMVTTICVPTSAMIIVCLWSLYQDWKDEKIETERLRYAKLSIAQGKSNLNQAYGRVRAERWRWNSRDQEWYKKKG